MKQGQRVRYTTSTNETVEGVIIAITEGSVMLMVNGVGQVVSRTSIEII